MKIDAPRTGIDPLSTALAQAAAAQAGAGAHAADLLAVAGAHLGLSGKPQNGQPALREGGAPNPPIAQSVREPGDNPQARMPALPALDTPVEDDYDPGAILRAHHGHDTRQVSERPAPERLEQPLPAASPERPSPAPPGPVELRQVAQVRPKGSRAKSSPAGAAARRKASATRWIIRGPALWLGASLVLVCVAFIFL